MSLLMSEEAWGLPPELYSCLNARGLYNPIQFVLRLRPDIHRALNSAPAGMILRNQLTEEQVMAFSTYLHETIHWWQHVGSTTGLILSLIYPAQCHLNHDYLAAILSDLGAVKPIRDYDLITAKSNNQNINVVLNNWHDIEFYRWFIVAPEQTIENIKSPYFECIGHCYEVAIAAVLWLLSSVVDPELKIFPDPRAWEVKFQQLRETRTQGFYHGSPIVLPPIAAKEIFEGQARFSQLQYLYNSSGGAISWDDFKKRGMFDGVYIKAFQCFIEYTKLDMPSKLDDSVVGLFLLVCDISMNPAECFVPDFDKFEELIKIHDPGWRFIQLCLEINANIDYFRSCVIDYSAIEYWDISEVLCTATGFTSPRVLSQLVTDWPVQLESISKLLDEDKSFDFTKSNLPVRVFLARFIRFQEDKLTTPEFFCWPGVWMTTANKGVVSPESAISLFEEHRALFLDKEDGDVYPRTFIDRDVVAVKSTFNSFYSWVAVYDLTQQWIIESGGFSYNFLWLTSKYSQSDVEAWASNSFREAFGVYTKDFKLVESKCNS